MQSVHTDRANLGIRITLLISYWPVSTRVSRGPFVAFPMSLLGSPNFTRRQDSAKVAAVLKDRSVVRAPRHSDFEIEGQQDLVMTFRRTSVFSGVIATMGD